MIINKTVFIDYLILILFLAASGTPYLSDPKINVLLFLSMSLIFFLRKKSLNRSFLLFFITLFSITLLQALKFDFISIITTIGLFTMIANAYMIVKILENNFIAYYINILYYMAIISFVFFFPFFLFPSLGNFFLHSIVPIFSIFNISHSVHETILVYNLSHVHIFRNSGPFWEPGAFAGYLVIAFMLNFIKDTSIKSKKNIVFLIAIGTTFSTTAFLSLFIFFFFAYFEKIKNILLKVGAITIIIAVGIYAYTTLDFLGKKIESQWQMAQTKGIKGSDDSQRFLNILRDIDSLKGHEFVGRGGNLQTRFDLGGDGSFIIPTVGLTDVIAKYGIPFFILILFFMYKSVCSYINGVKDKNQFYCFGMIAAILTTLISEVYFGYSMYWSLLFLQFAYGYKEEERRI